MKAEIINSEGSQNSTNVSKRQEKVVQMQNAFLIQLSEGKEAKEAFYDSIKSVNEKNNPKDDTFTLEDRIIYEGTGETVGCVMKKAGSFKITPEEAKKWLEVIAMIGPMIASFYDWINSILPKSHNQQEEQQAA